MMKFGPCAGHSGGDESEAAQLMGWQDRVGSVEAGNFADLVAVQAYPTADIAELERVKFVMKGGQVLKNELK